jgi:hypothetical protein
MTQIKIQYRDPRHLKGRYTPALRQIPELPQDSAEFLALAAGLKKAGFIRPILVDENDQVIDDHSRSLLVAALRWQSTEVPVQVCCNADAPIIRIHSLAHVRHLSKSAIAYLAVPDLQPALDAARMQMLEKLRKNPENVGVSAGDSGAQTVEELAQELGIGRNLLFEARAVRKEFEDKKQYQFEVEGGKKDGAEVRMTLREYFEPKIVQAFVAGEHNQPVSLGGILRSLKNIRSNDKSKFSCKNADQLELFVGTFGRKAIRQFKSWASMTDDARRQAREQIEDEAAKLKPEDCQAAAVALRDIAKIYADAAKAKA